MIEIYRYDNPIVRAKPQSVIEFNSTLGEVLDQMAHTMLRADGVGLAGTQVGFPFTVAVMKVDDDVIDLINPEIWDGDEPTLMKEACLSIPGYQDNVTRWAHVKGIAQKRDGSVFQYECHGFAAQVVQHEVDHLNGMLFVDRLIDSAKWRAWSDDARD